VRVLETDRLALRWITTDDAEFMLELLTDPAWLKFIGDRGVRDVEGAREYLAKGPIEMYARTGFGLYLTELKRDGTPIGLCGLVKRDTLDDVDIGFAFLPRFRSQGYAYEAASATMGYARDALGLRRVVAIATPDNHASARLLERLGLRFERMVRLGDGTEELKLFSVDLGGPG
jgi:RimJ/RimL family protein N-acetyltransferase